MIVAGVDEAGRGPLAGPVVVAAVILERWRKLPGLGDSKVLTAPERDRLATLIRRRCLAWQVVFVDVATVDRLNILQATLKGMRRAVERLPITPDRVDIDGNRDPGLELPTRTVVRGDARVRAIAAASILAKTARDRYMTALSADYPGYGFERHKGYGTRGHLTRLLQLGPCSEHRRTFAPVQSASQADLWADDDASEAP